MISLVLAALVLGADAPAQPAKGSVPGWFLFGESGAGVVRPQFGYLAGPRAAVTGGYGGSLDGVAMSTTLRVDFGLNLFGHYGVAPAINPAQLGLAIAIPDAAPDLAHSGLRFTPVFGVDVAFFNEDRLPAVPDRLVIGMPRLGGQLERRFGPLELAYRLEARGLFSRRIAFDLAQRFLAEVWVVPSFSIAAGLDWRTTWGAPPLSILPFEARVNAGVPTNLAITRAVVSWNFVPWVGLVLEGTWSHTFQWIGLNYSTNTLGGMLAFTFRTDPLLERNWLDR